MLNTLRARLSMWHLALLGGTLGTFAVLLYAVLANSLHHHHDDELREQAALVTDYLRGREVTDATVLAGLATARVSSRFVMIRGHDGELRFREPALQATEPNIGRHAVLTHAAMNRPVAPEFFTVDLEQSGAVRFICVPLVQDNLFLQIGDPIGDVRTTLDTLRDASLALIPLVLLVSSVGSWLLAKRALQPVRAIGTTLAEIGASDLSRRVEVGAADRELGIQPLLELGDVLRYRRLRQPERRGGGGDRAVFGEGDEVVELAEVEDGQGAVEFLHASPSGRSLRP